METGQILDWKKPTQEDLINISNPTMKMILNQIGKTMNKPELQPLQYVDFGSYIYYLKDTGDLSEKDVSDVYDYVSYTPYYKGNIIFYNPETEDEDTTSLKNFHCALRRDYRDYFKKNSHIGFRM